MTDETLESLLGLHRELQRREREAIATPEEARRANTELRLRMRERGNYLPEIEKLAEKQLKAAGHVSGALTHRTVSIMAEQLGFELIYAGDLPHSTRSITDLEHGRIYLPPASIPGGHGLRSMALQAMAHRLLGHTRPSDYADFLQQRLEINYYAACCLMPETPSVAFLSQAKKDRDLAVEDFRDAFGVTHEAAAMRMTNLLTHHFGIRLHFLRVDGSGALMRVYENDDLPLPMDVTGSIEGQIVCRRFSARSAFARQNRTTEHYQYTDTPAGTFWCSTQTGCDGCRRVLHHDRRALRRRTVVPRPRDGDARLVHLPRRVVLPASPAGRGGPLERQGLAERPRAHAHVLAAAAGSVPRCRRQRGVRVPRPARRGVSRVAPTCSPGVAHSPAAPTLNEIAASGPDALEGDLPSRHDIFAIRDRHDGAAARIGAHLSAAARRTAREPLVRAGRRA